MLVKSAAMDLLWHAGVHMHHGLSFQRSLLITELQQCEGSWPGEGEVGHRGAQCTLDSAQ